MEKTEILSEIKNLVLEQEPNAEIILFGSYARSSYNSESDLDVLILLDKEKVTFDDEKKITRPLFDLELATSQVISPLIRSKKSWYELYPNTSLFKNINREGIPL
jgi:predicted nucleotidyltransferase